MEPIIFLDYIKFGFELINKKMFEIEFKKMVYLTYVVIFQIKMIVCQNVNLPHIYG